MVMTMIEEMSAAKGRAEAKEETVTPLDYVSEADGPVMKLTDVAAYLGVGRDTVTRYVKQGLLRAKRTPLNKKLRLVPLTDVEEIKRQMDVLTAQRAHMRPKRRPNARHLRATHTPTSAD